MDKAKVEKIINLVNMPYESSCTRTPEYLHFHRVFRRNFTALLKEIGAVEIDIHRPNHFDASGFFKLADGRIFYFNIGDLRYGPTFLIRRAKDFKDYRGGSNMFCDLESADKFITSFEFAIRQLKEVI